MKKAIGYLRNDINLNKSDSPEISLRLYQTLDHLQQIEIGHLETIIHELKANIEDLKAQKDGLELKSDLGTKLELNSNSEITLKDSTGKFLGRFDTRDVPEVKEVPQVETEEQSYFLSDDVDRIEIQKEDNSELIAIITDKDIVVTNKFKAKVIWR